MRICENIFELWAVGLVLVFAAAAQQPSGNLTGIVLDPSGAPVPQVRIVLRGGNQETATFTSSSGEFQVAGLPAGAWQLQVAVPQFETIRRTVRIGGRGTPRLTLKLELAVRREVMIVSTDAIRLTTDSAGNADVIGVERRMLDTLPVLGMDYVSALARFLDPSGGGSPTLIVDGIESRNIGVTPSAIQEIRINLNPYTAEYPRWSRRRIEVITKSSADRFHGTFNFLFRDAHLDGRNAFAVERPPEQRRIYEGSLFGPVGRSKNTSFLLTGLREEEDLQAVVYAQGLAGPVRMNAPTPQQNTYASLRITRQFGDRQAAFWQYNYQDRFQYGLGVGGTTLPEAGANSRMREDEFTFNHRFVITPKLLSQFRILLGHYWNPTYSVVNAQKLVVSDAFTGGGAQSDGLRTEAHTSITWMIMQTAGRHSFKYGFNVPDWSRRGMKDLTNQLGTYSYASKEELLAGRPFSAVLQRGDPYAIFVEKNVGGFFQDDWQLKPNFSLSAGLRYDWQNNFGDANNLAPRLAFAYAPRRRREWVIRAGAGFFFERSGPGPVFDILRYDGQRLRRYVITDPRLLSPAVVLDRLPSSIARLDPAAQLPDIMQFSAGLERQLAKKTTLAVNYVGTRGVQQFRSRDANAPFPPDYGRRPDPLVNQFRQIESAGRMEGNSLEITVRGDLLPRITGVVQYVLGKAMTDTGGLNWFPAVSFAPSGEWGRSDTDRRNQFNLMATASLHRWVNLGVSVALLSGIPFNITTGHDENRDGMAGDRPAGVTRNTGLGPGSAVVDLRWYHEWRIRPKQKDKSPSLSLHVDAFNVFNRVNYANYMGAVSSPFFGRPVSAQPARRIQMGLRMQF